MFMRSTRRWKDGKEHTYWSIVENRRYTAPNKLQKLLLAQLELELPAQFPPRITSTRLLSPLPS
jgi:hypothetical protein